MKRAGINNLANPGFVPDLPDLLLPAGGWTNGRNVRYRDGSAEKRRGYAQALGSLSATSTWAQPITDGLNYYWAYGSGTVLYGTDGTTHTNISHLSLSYNASDDLGWTGGAFHGFVIANDATNIPQSWSPSLANRLISLTAWPAITCKVLRPFKDFLFALRNTTGGSYNPREVRWSDRAPQGGLPLSWDFTDPTNQAGITELGQSEDLVVDALGLRDSLIIYKESHTWAAEFVGALDIFGFRELFSEVGMMTENCALAFKSNHLVLTADDIVVHDGNSAQSIADKRTRKWLFNRINTNRYKRSFVVPDYRNREAWICFAETGYDWPNLALVWNWAEDSFDVMDLGGPKTWAVPGIVPGSSTAFDADAGTFDAATGLFDEETYSPFSKRLMLFDSLAKKAYQNDTGETYDGQAMSVFTERTGMGLTEDLGSIKRVWKVWPRLQGTIGDTLNFWIGTREAQQQPTSWSGPYPFTIGTDNWIDTRLDGRIFDLRVEYSGTNTFRLFGMSFDYEYSGSR